MNPEEVKTAVQARQIVEQRKLSHVKVGVFDADGVLRGRYMGREKFLSALEQGFGFCDVVLGWDSGDQPYDNVSLTGWHTAYPDALARIVPSSCRALPREGDMLLFLAEFDGEAEAACPRGLLKRVLKRAEGMGYSVAAAADFEFSLFEETPHSLRQKGFRDLKTLTPGFSGYSLLRASAHHAFHEQLLEMCGAMRMPLEGLHTESGPGMLEAALGYANALEAADRAALFKTFAKVLAQQNGLMATFMAKWSRDYPGHSGHLHLSLHDRRAKAVFHGPRKPHNMSDEMLWFIGGQQALMPELLAMLAPTVNSYARLVSGARAPTVATWGVENRSCALRVIPGTPKAQRVEVRTTGADINPYIALAAAIGSGLWGIEHKIEPDAPIDGSAYARSHPEARQFPPTLWDAAQRLKESEAAHALFGDAFVEHYAATREWEQRQFRKAVTDWELARYFEII